MKLQSCEMDEGVFLVRLDSETLQSHNVGEFKTAVREVLQAHTRLVLDLSDVKFIDSSGLSALLTCLLAAHARQSDLRLCSLNQSVRALFDLLRLNSVFSVHDDVDLALKSYA